MSETKTETTQEGVTITVNCQDEQVATAAFNLMVNKQSEFRGDLNKILANRGLGLMDTTFQDVDPEKLTFSIMSIPTDKGDVLTLNSKGNLQFYDYKKLKHEAFYGHVDAGFLKIFQYDEGAADKHVQTAGTLDALKQIIAHFNIAFAEQKAAQKAKEAERAASEANESEVLKVNRDTESK